MWRDRRPLRRHQRRQRRHDEQRQRHDFGCRGGTTTSGSGGGGPIGDGGIWGRCYKTDVEEQFISLVWPIIEPGCKSCHNQQGNPDFPDGGKWIFDGQPRQSLPVMISFAGMFDTVSPHKSEVLAKPLHMDQAYSEVFGTMVNGVQHDGGQKLAPVAPQFKARFDDIATFILYFDSCH